MGRERLAQKERRAAYQLLNSGRCERRSPTCEERLTLFQRINRNDHSLFGVRRLIELQLDDLHPLPPYSHLDGVYLDSHVTLLAYAAWRRRDIIVKQLLIAGANPAVRTGAPNGLLSYTKDHSAGHDAILREILQKLPGSSQVYLVEQVVYLRCAAIRSAVTGSALPGCQLCGRLEFSFRITPCGCICCEACLWLHFCRAMPPSDLCCPCCNCTVKALPEEVHDVETRSSLLPGSTRCRYCGYNDTKQRAVCPTCHAGRERHDERGSDTKEDVGAEVPKKKSQQSFFHAAPVQEVVYSILRRLENDDQRKEKLMAAAIAGNTTVICALASLGWPIDEPLDVYGQTALFVATFANQVNAVSKLLELRANPNSCAYGGSTPATTAASRGHNNVLRLLASSDADLNVCGSQRQPPIYYMLSRGLNNVLPLLSLIDGEGVHTKTAKYILRPNIVRLIEDRTHLGAGSCFIDGALPNEFLQALDHLYTTLPIAARERCTQGLNDRSYVFDAEGWICKALCNAVRIFEGVAPCQGEAMPHMRFLTYSEAGGGLPPHQDLSRTMNGRTSTCTFILYVTDCEHGGETVLLDSLAQPCNLLASVQPRRGRLLIFPHKCPHLAKAVDGLHLPKILLRGEMY